MILGEKSVRTYKLNEHTKVTVKSEKKAADVFTHTITVENVQVSTKPLEFGNKKAVAELVEGFDLEDVEQQSLL